MRTRRVALVAVLFAAIASSALAGQLGYLESPAKVALVAGAPALDLKGWPVVADGGEVGVVVDAIAGPDGDIERVRARVSMPMGLGWRVIDIPVEILSLTRDAVVLHVSVAELIESATTELRAKHPE